MFAILAAVGLVVAVSAIHALFRKINTWIHRVDRALKIQRLELASAKQVQDALFFLVHLARLTVFLMICGVFVSRILSQYPQAQPLAAEIRLAVLTPLEAMIRAMGEYLPNLIELSVILLLTRYVLKIIHLFFHAVDVGIIVIPDFYPDWAEPTYKIVRMVMFIFLPFVIIPLLPGANSQLFDKITFFIGLLVSLGSTSAIKNMTAGIVLTYTRSFQIGDRICIGDATGDVVEKSLFVTRLQTVKNEQIAIPNGSVLDSNIINYSALAQSHGLILHTSITIGYDVDWRQVQELLIAAALETPHIAADPPPFVLQTSLDDYYVAYEINAYTDHANSMAGTLSTLRQNILDSFHTAGVEIMSPSYSALRNGSDVAIPGSASPPMVIERERRIPRRSRRPAKAAALPTSKF